MRGPAILLLAALAAPAAALAGQKTLVEEAAYPEGPLWRAEALYYAEMTRDRVVRLAEGEPETFWRESRCGPTALAPFGTGGFAVLCHLGGRVVVIDKAGRTQRRIGRDARDRALVDPNDIAADGRGGVYFSDAGAFHPGAPASGKVYYLGPQGAPRRLVWDLHYANGVTVDRARGDLLVSEHLGRRIWRYPILGPGEIGPGEVLLDLRSALPAEVLADPLTGPDGLEVDRHGRLLFCLYGSGRVMMLDTQGRLSTVATLPEPFITNLSIDPSGSRIAVTAARNNKRRPYPGRVVEIPLPPL